MKKIGVLEIAFAVIAICLVKLAFFHNPKEPMSIVPQACAQGSIIEWKGGDRIISASQDGATTYVWDYDNRTEVRKYYIKNGELNLDIIKLKKD